MNQTDEYKSSRLDSTGHRGEVERSECARGTSKMGTDIFKPLG